jgi:hypothetical protein
MRTKLVEEERERIRIEEENFIRLPVTKADRYVLFVLIVDLHLPVAMTTNSFFVSERMLSDPDRYRTVYI